MSSAQHGIESLSAKLKKASTRLRVLEESQLSFKETKSFFNYVNSRRNGRDLIPSLTIGDKLVTDNMSKCETFSKFFAEVYVEPSDISSAQNHEPLESPFPSLCITGEKILNEIIALRSKCSYTPDGIPPVFYKNTSCSIVEPLLILFQRSYEEGQVPSDFLKSIVTPVFKKGLKELPDNYRPVAQSSIACILMEKLLVDHIENHLSALDQNDFSQHGFSRGKSTATQLVTVVHDWGLYLNRKIPVHCIYFDFKKAFDRVNHRLILNKLDSLLIDFKTKLWIKSYLLNRKFLVKIGDSMSKDCLCPSGVPQGSCLGPILFRIFVSDISAVIPAGISYKLFADDLKIYAPVSSVQDVSLLQQAVDSIANWCKDNEMLISVSKCAVVTSDGTSPTYILNGSNLPVAQSYKDLGVLINPRLDFTEQITAVVKSASILCNTIFRCFIIKRPEFYLSLYKALVLPKILYCSQVWTPYLSKDVSALEKVQHNFLRRVAKRCSISPHSISLPSIRSLHEAADVRLFNQLSILGLDVHIFNIYFVNLRRNRLIQSTEVARSERVNNLFSWRVPRLLRN